MFKYFAMKRKMKCDELKVKAMLYGTIAYILDEQSDIIKLVQRLYLALKDVSMEELRSELVRNIAEMIHKDNNDTKTEE